MLFRRRTAALAAATVLAAAGLVPAAHAGARNPVPFPDRPHGLRAPVKQPAAAEDPAGWFGQVSCNPVAQPGVRKLRDLALRTYQKGYDGGVTRSCVSGGDSEHKEGRAWDWMLDVSKKGHRRAAGDFLSWLTRDGGLQARRLGIMYVIYNRKSWASYRQSWEPYSGSSPHTDHIHLSFSWAGARGRTSFWTGRVAGTDYGPCVVFRGQLARLTRRPNPTPCAGPARPVMRSSRGTAIYGASGNTVVRKGQRALGLPVSGRFDARTWRAVKRFQRGHELPATGALDKATWAVLAPRSVTWNVTEGYGPRAAARYANTNYGDETLRRGAAGASVAFLQKALRLPVAQRNGWFGPRTAQAVKQLKAKHGLVRNAVVNARVWRAIDPRHGR